MEMLRSLATIAAIASAASLADAAASSCTRPASKSAVVAPPAPTKTELADLAWLPTQFDWCEQGYCGATIEQAKDAADCGGCYLTAALDAAQDRIKIEKKAPGDAVPMWMLNRQSFLNCGPTLGLSAGCTSGAASDVFEFMWRYGLPDETCLPYTGTDHNALVLTYGSCSPELYCASTATKNADGVQVARYRAKTQGQLVGEYAIIKELLRGPVTCALASTEALETSNASSVFEDTTGATSITHDVEVVGWGEENGVKFWHVRHALGPQWGDGGFFKLVRGKNNLGIEADCHYVVPGFVNDKLEFVQTPINAGGAMWKILSFDETRPEIATPTPAESAAVETPASVVVKPAAVVVKSSDAAPTTTTSWLTSTRTVVVLVVVVAAVGGAFGVRAYRQRRSQGYLPLH